MLFGVFQKKGVCRGSYPKGPKHLQSKMSGSCSRNYHGLGKYPPEKCLGPFGIGVGILLVWRSLEEAGFLWDVGLNF